IACGRAPLTPQCGEREKKIAAPDTITLPSDEDRVRAKWRGYITVRSRGRNGAPSSREKNEAESLTWPTKRDNQTPLPTPPARPPHGPRRGRPLPRACRRVVGPPRKNGGAA